MKTKSNRILSCLGGTVALSVMLTVPVFAEGTWEDKAAANVNTYANIRSEATIDSARVGRLPRGGVATVVGEENGWYQVVSGDIEGYIRGDLLVIGEEAQNLYETIYGQGDEESVSAESISQPQEVAEESASTVSASNDELALMAAIIECEAGGESYEGKVAVGAVVMNRINSSRFPNSLSEVIYQRGQFSPVASGKLSRVLARGARQDCYDAAIDVFNGANNIGNRLFFSAGSGRGMQIGNQHFY